MSSDTYNVQGQAGAVGRGAHAHDMDFQQVWQQRAGDIDLTALAADLGVLANAMQGQAREPDQHAATGSVRAAQQAAADGDGPAALSYLARAGGWALAVADKAGVGAAAAAAVELVRTMAG